jgi:hypothetical protein
MAVPTVGTHHPFWPFWGWACRSRTGRASCMSTQSHFMSVSGTCVLPLSSASASFLNSTRTFLISVAASFWAIFIMAPAEMIARWFRCILLFLLSSRFWTRSRTLLRTTSSCRSRAFFLAFFSVSGPKAGAFGTLGFRLTFLFQTVRLAWALFAARVGMDFSHSSCLAVRSAHIEAEVFRCLTAVSFTRAKAAIWPMWRDNSPIRASGTMPSTPHSVHHPAGWFRCNFQLYWSQFSPRLSHSCHVRRSSSSHILWASQHSHRACSTVSFGWLHDVHFPCSPMCSE